MPSYLCRLSNGNWISSAGSLRMDPNKCLAGCLYKEGESYISSTNNGSSLDKIIQLFLESGFLYITQNHLQVPM